MYATHGIHKQKQAKYVYTNVNLESDVTHEVRVKPLSQLR